MTDRSLLLMALSAATTSGRMFLMKYFALEISRPVRKNDAELEYLPTQVFCEFLRTSKFRAPDALELTTFAGMLEKTGPAPPSISPPELRIDGVRFQSCRRPDGINITVFGGPDISKDSTESNAEAWLEYKSYRQYKVSGVEITGEWT